MLDLLKGAGAVVPEDIEISFIRTDGETQMRAKLNEETVADYVEKMQNGARFPPVELYYDGSHYWVGDGFHRIAAWKRASPWQRIAANVRSGSRRKAILHAVGANDDHGLPRTNADKRRAVETLLMDAEWAAWSDRAIAEACRVTHPLVAKVRKELSGNGFQMPTERVVQRNGTTYTQETAGISVANAGREKPTETVDPVYLAQQVAKEKRGGLTKREYAVQLMPEVISWLRVYRDRHGRTWRDLVDVAAHTNSRHWFDITNEWTRREIYYEEDTLKAAIELALIELQQEGEPAAVEPPPKAVAVYTTESAPPSMADDLAALRQHLLAARPHIERAERIAERLGHKLWMSQALSMITMELKRAEEAG